MNSVTLAFVVLPEPMLLSDCVVIDEQGKNLTAIQRVLNAITPTDFPITSSLRSSFDFELLIRESLLISKTIRPLGVISGQARHFSAHDSRGPWQLASVGYFPCMQSFIE